MSTFKQRSLPEWIDYIQTLHSREIELSLDRVGAVYGRLFPNGVDFKVITVAGTNGKGSTAELLSSIYAAASYRVGKFTSPHLVNFNERFRINQKDVDDASLIGALCRIEEARKSISLTFFEYGTLVAIVLFADAAVDIAVMEVGLGGRLDAINILDADAAIVTNISIDHVSWLGDTIEEIGREKIAIARANKPCVIGMSNPPQSIIEYCQQQSIQPLLIERDFSIKFEHQQEHWCFQSKEFCLDSLPLPFNQAGHQLDNAAVAIQTVHTLLCDLPLADVQIADGIRNAMLAGRCQLVSQRPSIILDVSHNVASISRLANFVLSLEIKGQVSAVCGMLSDKQIGESLVQLDGVVDKWYFASLNNPRGASAEEVEVQLLGKLPTRQGCHQFQSQNFDSVLKAYQAAKEMLTSDDCLLVFGSFFVVGDIIAAL